MRNAAILVAVLTIAGAAYWLGTQHGTQSAIVPQHNGHDNGTRQVTGSAAPAPDAKAVQMPVAPNHGQADPHAGSKATGSAHTETPDGVKFEHYRVGNRNVKAILSDGGVLWVGTSGGVVRYDLATDEHRLFDVRSGLLSNGIFHLSKLGDRLVVGTYGGGLSLLDPTSERWTHYNVQNGLADAFVYGLLTLSNGDIWIATWSGANRIRNGALDDRSAWETYTVANTNGGLPNDWVYGLAEGKNGDIWMATEGGLTLYRDGTWANWQHEDGLGADYELVRDDISFTRDPAKESNHHARQKQEMGLMDVDVAYNPNYIVSLMVDEAGVVWAGTWGGGLARFDGKTFKNFTVRDGLPANHVFMLGRELEGRMWIGTSNGLSRFDGESFKTFGMNDGLFAENIFSMAYGTDRSLWLGSYGGVAKIKGLERVN